MNEITYRLRTDPNDIMDREKGNLNVLKNEWNEILISHYVVLRIIENIS